MEYKGVNEVSPNLFEAWVDIDEGANVGVVLIDTFDTQTEAASVVGIGLKNMGLFTGDEAVFAEEIKALHRQDPPSLHEFYREKVEITPEKTVQNLAATGSPDVVITWDAVPGATEYLVYLRELVSGAYVDGGVVADTTVTLTGVPAGDYTINVRVNDVYYDITTINYTVA